METKKYIEQSLYKGKVNVKFFPDSHQYWIDGKRKTGTTTYLSIIDKSSALVGWAVDLALNYLREPRITRMESSYVITEEDLYQASIQHTIKKMEAANIGTISHDWIEKYIDSLTVAPKYRKVPEMPETKEVQIAVNAFLDWEKANDVKFLSSERLVYSKKHDYIGTLDIEAKVNGKLCLIDIKTSNNIYNNYALQTAAYLKADEEESGKKYKGRWIIRLAKETEKEYEQRMDRKNLDRARKGSTTFTPPPYQVFEARYLDEEECIDRDFKAFLAAKALYTWDRQTNLYAQKA